MLNTRSNDVGNMWKLVDVINNDFEVSAQTADQILMRDGALGRRGKKSIYAVGTKIDQTLYSGSQKGKREEMTGYSEVAVGKRVCVNGH